MKHFGFTNPNGVELLLLTFNPVGVGETYLRNQGFTHGYSYLTPLGFGETYSCFPAMSPRRATCRVGGCCAIPLTVCLAIVEIHFNLLQ
ncbi:MAG: hypothetical protein ABIS74_00485 [Ferruginibacter sp.]